MTEAKRWLAAALSLGVLAVACEEERESSGAPALSAGQTAAGTTSTGGVPVASGGVTAGASAGTLGGVASSAGQSAGTPMGTGGASGMEAGGAGGDPVPTAGAAGEPACATGEQDSDADGTPDCDDGCSEDALKTAPGRCGCGEPDPEDTMLACGEEPAPDPLTYAAGLHELFMHDACTGEYPPQPDTCLHEQQVEQTVVFGGEPGTTYDVTLRVRGLFEPTTISGGTAPLPAHPYFKIGGRVSALDWSHWHIEVAEPAETYWLNHYPGTQHIIYQEDFEITIPIAAGSEVVVRVIDGNDRQMDNAEPGLADRRQLIEGVTSEVLDGQMIRLDVLSVVAR